MFGCYRLLCRLTKQDSETALRQELGAMRIPDPFRSERRKQIIRSKILSGIRTRMMREDGGA